MKTLTRLCFVGNLPTKSQPEQHFALNWTFLSSLGFKLNFQSINYKELGIIFGQIFCQRNGKYSCKREIRKRLTSVRRETK